MVWNRALKIRGDACDRRSFSCFRNRVENAENPDRQVALGKSTMIIRWKVK